MGRVESGLPGAAVDGLWPLGVKVDMSTALNAHRVYSSRRLASLGRSLGRKIGSLRGEAAQAQRGSTKISKRDREAVWQVTGLIPAAGRSETGHTECSWQEV